MIFENKSTNFIPAFSLILNLEMISIINNVVSDLGSGLYTFRAFKRHRAIFLPGLYGSASSWYTFATGFVNVNDVEGVFTFTPRVEKDVDVGVTQVLVAGISASRSVGLYEAVPQPHLSRGRDLNLCTARWK